MLMSKKSTNRGGGSREGDESRKEEPCCKGLRKGRGDLGVTLANNNDNTDNIVIIIIIII